MEEAEKGLLLFSASFNGLGEGGETPLQECFLGALFSNAGGRRMEPKYFPNLVCVRSSIS